MLHNNTFLQRRIQLEVTFQLVARIERRLEGYHLSRRSDRPGEGKGMRSDIGADIEYHVAMTYTLYAITDRAYFEPAEQEQRKIYTFHRIDFPDKTSSFNHQRRTVTW